MAVLSFVLYSSISLRIASLLRDACQRRNLESCLRGYGLLVGEWVVTGFAGWCVGWLTLPPPIPSTTNIRLLNDARYTEQTLHGGRVDAGR